MTAFYRAARAIARTVMTPIYPYKVVGRENVPSNAGFIMAANHTSNMDALFAAFALNKHMIHYMSKIELYKNPIMRFVMNHLGAFAVDRGKGDKASLDHAIGLIKDNKVMGIFPEGRRSKDGKPLRAKSGIAVVASAAKADILPVHIIPQTKGGMVKPFHKTVIVIGNVIKYEELGLVNNVPSEFKAASRLIMQEICDTNLK